MVRARQPLVSALTPCRSGQTLSGQSANCIAPGVWSYYDYPQYGVGLRHRDAPTTVIPACAVVTPRQPLRRE